MPLPSHTSQMEVKQILQNSVAGGCRCMFGGTRKKSKILPPSTLSPSAGMRAIGHLAGDSFIAARANKR